MTETNMDICDRLLVHSDGTFVIARTAKEDRALKPLVSPRGRRAYVALEWVRSEGKGQVYRLTGYGRILRRIKRDTARFLGNLT